jgi:arginyl-tRNA synthetase
LIKRDGTALYATRDLALARRKFDEFKVDRSIYVVDSAQTLHFQQVFACLEAMGYERARDCYHVAYAQVVRPDGKMSSRKGNVILFSELRARLLAKIRSEYLDKYQGDWPSEEIAETADALALATIRYGMLNQDSNSLVVFDLDEWTARSGNTGPYMLYAVARIHSIIREAGNGAHAPNWSLLVDPSERDLLIALLEYPSVVVRAADNYAPNTVCAYIYDLSKRFNRFYHECSVLHAEDPSLRAARLALCDAVGKTISHGLDLLGIRTVNRM